jgi:hypothetical protein
MVDALDILWYRHRRSKASARTQWSKRTEDAVSWEKAREATARQWLRLRIVVYDLMITTDTHFVTIKVASFIQIISYPRNAWSLKAN